MSEPVKAKRALPIDDPSYEEFTEAEVQAGKRVANTGSNRLTGSHPFTKSLFATVLTTLIPASGLLFSKENKYRLVGAVTAVISLSIIGYLAYQLTTNLTTFAAFSVRPKALYILTGALIAGAMLWVAMIIATQLLLRPRKLTQTQRLVGSIAVGFLSLAVAAPMAVAARYASAQAGFVSAVFSTTTKSETRPTLGTDGEKSVDVWAKKPRLNVLLLGSDSSLVRRETIQAREEGVILTDTIMVASIDTKTGNITMVQVPRNMGRTPFPPGSPLAELYPDGFWDGSQRDNAEYMVNNLWYHVEQEHPEIYANSTYPGAEAMKVGIGEATGLNIDYFIMIDLDGMQNLIDAVGGITVNINQRLAIGGDTARGVRPSEWLEPGPNQHLDGRLGLWYARSRYNTDDYDRMARQSCTVQAIIKRGDPINILQRFEAIAAAGQQMVTTDIPQEDLPHFIELADRVKKSGKMNRVLFKHGEFGFNYSNPDFDQMRERVREAINAEKASATPTPTTTPTGSPTGSPSATDDPASTRPSDGQPSSSQPAGAKDVEDACAYNPVE